MDGFVIAVANQMGSFAIAVLRRFFYVLDALLGPTGKDRSAKTITPLKAG